MDRFQAMRVFSQIVESGSFAKAAEKLGLSTSATSRYLADLETHLSTQLLQRTTRRISLTETGRGFYERCAQILAELDDAERDASQASAIPRGTIRLTTSINFGTRHVTPAIAGFLARYPQLKFDVSLSDRVVDLVEEGFDLAIRIGAAGPGTLVARKLGETRLVPCAAPAYLAKHGLPATPEELKDHNCLTYEYALSDEWSFIDAAGRKRTVRVSGSLNSNNGDLLAEAAAQGLGVICEPTFNVGAEIRAGRLVPILQEFSAPRSPIYAVYASRRNLSARVRLFVDFLVERFGDAADFTRA